MSLIFLLVAGYVCAVSAAEETVTAWISENVTLPCRADRKPGVQYRAVRWYKEEEESRLTGLVSRSPLDTPPGGVLRWYVGADTRISLEYPSLELQLPPVTCSDSGVYQCYLAAPVGEQNRQGRVRLTVTGCPVEQSPVVPDAAVLNHPEVLVLVAAVLLFTVLILAFVCLFLRRWRWTKAKAVDKALYPDLYPDLYPALYPDLSRPLEKQVLKLPVFISSSHHHKLSHI